MRKIINIIEEFIIFIFTILLGIGSLLGEYFIIPLARKDYGIILLILFTISLFLTIFFTDGWLNIICFLLFTGWCFLCFALMMLYSLGAINKANMTGEELECDNTTETYNQQ